MGVWQYGKVYTFSRARRIFDTWITLFSRKQATPKMPHTPDHMKEEHMHAETRLIIIFRLFAVFFFKISR